MQSKSNWRTSGNLGTDYEQFLVPAMFGPWAPLLVQFADVAPGERVLDVACGTGIVARKLSERVGVGGAVVGCDNNAAMLATAKQVAPDIDGREGNALESPFDAYSIDAVTCQHGYQFFPDRVKAAQEAHRVLVDGGRLAVSVWCSLAKNPKQAAVVSAVAEFVGSADAAIVGSPFAFGDKEELKDCVVAAGFERVRSTTEMRPARFPSTDELVLGMVRGGALARAGVGLSEETIELILGRVREALAKYQGATELVFPMAANLVLGQK